MCDGYDEHHSHYLAGTPMGAPIPLPKNGSVAACCATCSTLKTCDGWVLQNSTAQKPECVLLSNGTLKDNPNGIVSAQRERGRHEYCWYDSNSTYRTWKDSCSMKNCSCDAMNKLSLGLEDHAMCWNRGPPHNRTLRVPNRTHWWNLTGADCDSGVEEGDCDSSTPEGVTACKKKCLDDPYCGGFNSDNHLKYADCVKDMQQQSGSMKLWVLKDTPQPASAAGDLVAAPPPPPDYDTWMQHLACLMDGNWYSSQAAGQCKDGADTDCWWRLVSPENGERAVNASCVDDRVQSSLRRKNEACWAACAQPDNATALCPVSCLFETMIGNPTTGRKPLTKEEVVSPFEAAFDDPSQGGCADP